MLADNTLAVVKRDHVLKVLKINDGNRTYTALDLGISSRGLRYMLGNYKKDGFDIMEIYVEPKE